MNFLQEIGKKLLTEYVIKIGDVTIKPLTIYAATFTSITQFAKLFLPFHS